MAGSKILSISFANTSLGLLVMVLALLQGLEEIASNGSAAKGSSFSIYSISFANCSHACLQRFLENPL